MKITCPIYWYISKKKPREALSLNWYRNCHFRTLHKVKKEYTSNIHEKLNWEQIRGQYGVSLSVYLRSTSQDVDNFTSIALKFTLDALVEAWVLEGDSNKHCIEIHSVFKGVDKDNPRIEIEIIT